MKGKVNECCFSPPKVCCNVIVVRIIAYKMKKTTRSIIKIKLVKLHMQGDVARGRVMCYVLCEEDYVLHTDSEYEDRVHVHEHALSA